MLKMLIEEFYDSTGTFQDEDVTMALEWMFDRMKELRELEYGRE